MKKMILLLALTLSGCSFGYNSYVSATMITNDTYPPSTNNTEVIFEDKPIHREYDQIAYLEAISHESSRLPELLSLLKDKAKSIGADAVIFIKKRRQTRSSRDLIIDTMSLATGDRIDNDEYEAPVLTGIAIRYKNEPETVNNAIRSGAGTSSQ